MGSGYGQITLLFITELLGNFFDAIDLTKNISSPPESMLSPAGVMRVKCLPLRGKDLNTQFIFK